MKVKLEAGVVDGVDDVSLANVRFVKIDRGDRGEVLISNRMGCLSIYQNGRVIYTEEKKVYATRDNKQAASDAG